MNIRNRRSWSLAMGGIAVILILIAYGVIRENSVSSLSASSPKAFQSRDEATLWRFIVRRMATASGEVYQYNPHTASQRAETPRLSESVGLLLDYAVMSHDAPLFDEQVAVLRRHFVIDDGIVWRVPSHASDPVNSTVDDLRILHALILGAHRFHQPAVGQLAQTLAQGLLRHDAVNGWLVDEAPVDGTAPQAAVGWVAVRYWNVQTLHELIPIDAQYRHLYAQAYHALAQSQNTQGLYAIAYNPTHHQWFFGGSSGLNINDELLAALHAQAAGLGTRRFGRGLFRLLQSDHKLPLRLSTSWHPLSQETSAATYAMAARFFADAGNRAGVQLCMARLLAMRVGATSGNRAERGAFSADPQAGIYSFDQLETLLTLREVGGNA